MLCFASGAFLFEGRAEDLLLEISSENIDRSRDKGSGKFLSDGILQAFGESRLDSGSPDGRTAIRLIVFRSFEDPLMFKFVLGAEGKEPYLDAKRISKAEDGVFRVTQNRRLLLRPEQESLLLNVYATSPIDDLPQDDWQEPGLDGTQWIYEITAKGRHVLLSRSQPMQPHVEGVEITKERLAREMSLTSFALVLWTLAGIDDFPS